MKDCGICNDPLEVGVNWTKGAAKHNYLRCQPCLKIIRKEYYEANKPDHARRSKEWALMHPEEKLDHARKSRQKVKALRPLKDYRDNGLKKMIVNAVVNYGGIFDDANLQNCAVEARTRGF